nr:hypothetical protein [Tanacetum cinerariifolium]
MSLAFFNQSDSLWVGVIHAIHGVDGRIGRAGNVGCTSIWCDIIKEMDKLASHGIDLISMMHKKIEKWLNTSFCEDQWRGEQRLKEAFSRIYALEWDHLLDSLEGVMLNPSKDRWSWDLNGSMEFSVASARRYIDNNRLPDISSKTRWIKEMPIKVNVHAWKVNIFYAENGRAVGFVSFSKISRSDPRQQNAQRHQETNDITFCGASVGTRKCDAV